MQAIDSDAGILFQSLSDRTRLRIIRLLADSKKELCLCEIVDSLEEPNYNISRHLKVLRQAGLLVASKDGRWICHKIRESKDYLSSLYELVRKLPDSEGVFAQDAKRFQKRMGLKIQGRCRTETVPLPQKQKRSYSAAIAR